MLRNYLSGALLIIIGIAVILYVFNLFPSTNNNPIITDVSKKLQDVKSIQIETEVTAITVSESDDDHFYAVLEHASSNKSKSLTLDLTDTKADTLKLTVKSQKRFFSLFSIGSLDSKLIVKIPKEYTNKLKIETNTGRITINGTQVSDLKLSTDTGGVSVSQLASNDIEIESTTGSIQVNELSAGALKLESTTGSIKLNGATVDELKAESSTGSIQIDGHINRFDVESTTGSIQLKQEDVYHDSKLKSTTGSIQITLNDEPQSLLVSYETKVGNYKLNTTGYNMIQNSKNQVEFQYGDGETKLEVETTTGNFTFN